MSLLEILRRIAKNINSATNDMQGSPYWNTYKKLIKIHFKQNKIVEISVIKFSELTGLKKDIALKMLTEINKELFNKKSA